MIFYCLHFSFLICFSELLQCSDYRRQLYIAVLPKSMFPSNVSLFSILHVTCSTSGFYNAWTHFMNLPYGTAVRPPLASFRQFLIIIAVILPSRPECTDVGSSLPINLIFCNIWQPHLLMTVLGHFKFSSSIGCGTRRRSAYPATSYFIFDFHIFVLHKPLAICI